MKDLEQCRKEIDEINKEMIQLFEKRMAISKDVVLYKKAHNMPIFQPERENAIIESNIKDIKNQDHKQYVASFLQDLMDVSKSYQATFIDTDKNYQTRSHKKDQLQVGYQGVPGAFSYQAMMEYFGDVKHQNYNHFEDVFKALVNKEIDYGILPLENSSTGAINDNYDLVREYNLYIVGELSLSVSQHLLGIPGAKEEDIHEVYSHPQGIYQCSKYLYTRKDIMTHEYSNTAASAKLISELKDQHIGAIASSSAAKIYGLDILHKDIHDEKSNHTRFIVIGRHLEDEQDANCCSIVFTLAHRPGSLSQILRTIKDHNINLSRIESRPIKDKNWEYYFYIDFEGSIHNQEVKTTLAQIQANCLELRVLGNYRHD